MVHPFDKELRKKTMSELIEVIKDHLDRYPEMEINDVFKLIYQNEYGGNHLILDPAASLAQIKDEYGKIHSARRKPKVELYEEIGNGYVRVNLGALDPEVMSLEQLNEAFILSGEKYRGTLKGLQEKIAEVKEHFSEFGFEFEETMYVLFAAAMKEACYPPISHSDTYRVLYKPAYRVVKKEILGL